MAKKREDLEDILEEDEDQVKKGQVQDDDSDDEDDEDEDEDREEEDEDKDSGKKEEESEEDDKNGKETDSDKPEKSNENDSETSDSSDEDEDEDQEARREERRQARREKKQRQREAREAKDRLIETLKRQNEELVSRVSAVEKSTRGHEIAQVDQAIDAHERAIRTANDKISEAIKKQDGNAFTAAQQARDELKGRLDRLKVIKQGMSRTDNKSGTSVLSKPETMDLAKKFATKHSWYDVAGKDEDSQIVSLLDQRLYEEGYDPSSQSYWDELESRVRRRLPHKFKVQQKKASDDKLEKRKIVGKPGSMGSNKANGGVQSMKGMPLSKQRREAMLESGLQPGTKEWNDQVKAYAKWDKQHGKGA